MKIWPISKWYEIQTQLSKLCKEKKKLTQNLHFLVCPTMHICAKLCKNAKMAPNFFLTKYWAISPQWDAIDPRNSFWLISWSFMAVFSFFPKLVIFKMQKMTKNGILEVVFVTTNCGQILSLGGCHSNWD